ncbi:hypothetical protein WJX73_007094 [Symbiochloris irregularis]|uniref:Uncharacterized protein n=1 Tax=Symbiochloris irregularis TaxID=706552 RepID=A0AAW1PZP3_9CHLO
MAQSTSRGLHRALGCLASTSQPATISSNQSSAAGALLQHTRAYGAPEYFGRPSPYTQGTDFLGTPTDYLERINKRPVSPHVFEIDSATKFHYKMPLNAISSIANRATGVALSTGLTAAGCIALTGDLPGTVEAFKASYPWLVFPAKALVAGPIVYHYLGGMRHLLWDKSKIGNQAEKKSYLDLPAVDKSSYVLFGATAAATLGLAVYSI